MQLNYRGNHIFIDKKDLHFLQEKMFWMHHSGYLYCKVKGKHKSLHRLIMQEPVGTVDHINRNKRDYRRKNLRVVTIKENILNRDIQKNNTTGYRGVFYLYKIKKYFARVGRGNAGYIGCFSCKWKAAQAYNKKAKEMYGKFAVLNKKEG